LIFATVATLFFVPSVFVLIHGRDKLAVPGDGTQGGSEADGGIKNAHG
jgi:hypothetical protein